LSLTVFFAVIVAAMLHATWNALVKSGGDKHRNMLAVVVGHAPYAALILPFVPAPAAVSWPYLAVGIGLHAGYQIFLLQSYRVGDLTQVYPIARGTAPMLVAAVSVLFLGVTLGTLELLAIATIGAGIISLGLVRQRDGLRNPTAGMLAFVTGCFIAGYSLVDGLGARAAGTALGFYGWLTIGNGLVIMAYIAVVRPQIYRGFPGNAKTLFLVGGGASYAAYALVIWSFTQAPIALVTALRETSIVFALLIGVIFLKERLDLAKVASTLVTVFGAALLRIARH
jgi:drug/metabolite transporter (DMT)-like permease